MLESTLQLLAASEGREVGTGLRPRALPVVRIRSLTCTKAFCNTYLEAAL